jgi:hypothetical protein
MLKMFYKWGPANDWVIDRVEEWMSSTQQGRTVTYSYSKLFSMPYSALTPVSFGRFGDSDCCRLRMEHFKIPQAIAGRQREDQDRHLEEGLHG